MKETIFRTAGIARVAHNPDIGQREIEVLPVEWMSMKQGEISPNPTPIDLTSTDQDGNQEAVKLNTDLVISATWLPGATNRVSPPNVRRGERVELFTVGDTGKYYWRPLGLDDHLRKLETIIIGISATRDEADTELRPDNMYWFELSSHSKRLAFSSSKADGEPFVYEMFFDFEEGSFTLTDDIGNFINLISKLHLIHLQNTDGTFVKLDKKDIKGYAPGNIEGKADKDISLKAGKNISVEAGADISAKSGAATTVDAGSTASVKSGAAMTLDSGAALDVKSAAACNIEAGAALSVKGMGVTVESAGPAMVKGAAGLTLDGGGSMLVLGAAGAAMTAPMFSGG